MLNSIKLLFILIIFTPLLVKSQVGGQSTYQFLNIVSSARSTALGGNIISVKDSDVNFAKWNPALINSSMDGKLALNYLDYFSDINIGSVSYAYSFDSLGTFAANISYINYGEFARSINGENDGVFSANELSLNLGYSYNIDSLWTVGANAKIINSVLDSWNSFGVAVDLGATYKIPNKKITIGLVARNIGVQLKTYSGHDRENLPFQIQLGFSHELEHLPLQWSLTLDNLQQWNVAFANPSNTTIGIDNKETAENITFLDNAVRHVIIGAELFPRRNFSVRASYNFRKSAEMNLANYKHFGGFSFGFGMKIKKFRVAYARSLFHPASGTNNFRIATDLGAF